MTLDDGPALPPGRHLELEGHGQLLVRDIAGPDGAPVLMLLHGWTVSSDLNWFNCYAELSRHYRVIAFDHRGHGQGLRAEVPFRLEDCADDAVRVADTLGVDRFVPLGYSMGGAVAQLIWRRHPERVTGLVLCSTASSFNRTRRNRAEFSIFGPVSKLARAVPDRVIDRVVGGVIDWRTSGRGLSSWALNEVAIGDAVTVLEAGRMIGQFDSSRWVGRIDVPTAIVITNDDAIVSPERQRALASALGDPYVVEVEGDHDVVVLGPGVYVPALLDACRNVVR